MTTRLNGYTIGNQYELLNNAAQMDMKRAINKWKQTPRGDREIVFEKAQKLSRRGMFLPYLLVALKATLSASQKASAESEVIRG